jgi:recombination protein RecA
MYGKGVAQKGELIDLGADLGIVDKAGSWYSFEGTRIGQGRDNAMQYLDDHPEISNVIDTKVRTHFGLISAEGSESEETPDNVTPMPEKRRSNAKN